MRSGIGIPLVTLRDWERSPCEPHQPSRAWLTVIAHDPERVKRALAGRHFGLKAFRWAHPIGKYSILPCHSSLDVAVAIGSRSSTI